MQYRRNDPISQVEIENELLRLMSMLEEETEAFESLAEDAAKKDALYKANWAKEYLAAKGSIKEREAWLTTSFPRNHMTSRFRRPWCAPSERS